MPMLNLLFSKKRSQNNSGFGRAQWRDDILLSLKLPMKFHSWSNQQTQDLSLSPQPLLTTPGKGLFASQACPDSVILRKQGELS